MIPVRRALGRCGFFMTLTILIATAGLGPDAAVMAREERSGNVRDVTGNVTLTSVDGAMVPANGARLTLSCETEQAPRVEVADALGGFRFERVPKDGCAIVTDLQGFRSEKVAIKAAETSELQLRLELEPVFAGVTVGGVTAAAPIGCHTRRGCVRVGPELGSVRGKIRSREDPAGRSPRAGPGK